MTPKAKDNLVFLGMILVLVVGATMVVYLPQNRRIKELRAEAVSTQGQLKSDATLVAAVPAMVRESETLKARYSNFDRKLPAQQELHEFLKQINNSLTASGLTNQSIEPGTPTRDTYFNTLPIQMKFQGSFFTLAKFLESLEGMERLSRVQSLKVEHAPASSAGRGADSDNALSIEMEIAIFFTEK